MSKLTLDVSDVEIAGLAAKSMVDNLETPQIKSLVERVGLDDIRANQWVPMEQMVQLFDMIDQAKSSSTQAYVAMGMRIAEQSEFPPEMLKDLTMETMIMEWDTHYRINHRGGNLPEIKSVQTGETSYELHMEPPQRHPYPYDMTYGMVYAFCRRLLPKGTNAVVKYDDMKSPYNDPSNGVVLQVSW